MFLSFDDHSTLEWSAVAPWLKANAIRATFYVSEIWSLGPGAIDSLRRLRDDGHEIEYHGWAHVRADHVRTPEEWDAYLAEEIARGVNRMADLGLPVHHFSYPKGCSTPESDRRLSRVFLTLRKTLRPGVGSCVYAAGYIPTILTAANVELRRPEIDRRAYDAGAGPEDLICVFAHLPSPPVLMRLAAWAARHDHRFVGVNEVWERALEFRRRPGPAPETKP